MFFGHRAGAGAGHHLPERRHGLEHVPEKLTGFFDQNMLQLLESERFLYDQMILSDREALQVRQPTKPLVTRLTVAGQF
ncbi:MAG: hypothetical protein ACLQFI_17425 [Methylocella sp.]|jgi:hypothetical protein